MPSLHTKLHSVVVVAVVYVQCTLYIRETNLISWKGSTNHIQVVLTYNYQAQPKLQVQIEAELALISLNPATLPTLATLEKFISQLICKQPSPILKH